MTDKEISFAKIATSRLLLLASKGSFEATAALNCVMAIEDELGEIKPWECVVPDKEYGIYINHLCNENMDLVWWRTNGCLPITDLNLSIIK